MRSGRPRDAVDNHAAFDGLDVVAKRKALRGGQAGRVADLDAVRQARKPIGADEDVELRHAFLRPAAHAFVQLLVGGVDRCSNGAK